MSLLVVLALLIVAATLAGQIAYLRNREKDTDAEMKRDFPRDTHAGGVVYKLENETALYLLVSSKNGGAATFLPRGHIDPGEGHAEAALREVCEETGVVARLRGLVGRAKFEVFDQKAQKNKTIRVKYFLMERLCDTVKEDEERNRSHAWLSYDKALEIMPSETGEILRKAEQLRLRKLHETKSTAAADVAKSG